jgi:hypothetical protein
VGDEVVQEPSALAAWSALTAAAASRSPAGSDPNWIPDWENRTSLDAAIRSGATDVAWWLRVRGASTAAELGR